LAVDNGKNLKLTHLSLFYSLNKNLSLDNTGHTRKKQGTHTREARENGKDGRKWLTAKKVKSISILVLFWEC